MKSVLNRTKTAIAPLWRGSAPMTVAGLLMLGMFVLAIVGLAVDPRLVTGAPVWLKPAKFAISTAIYMLTLAWVMTLLPEWPRTRRVVGWLTAMVLVLEVAIIVVQAWRGTASHFNVSTPLDGALFSFMGLAIVVQTLTSVAVAVALWRQRFEDRALGWALRWGMIITIIGASTGGLMVRPTAAQLEGARAGRMTIAGAHTVGAPDGGRGLPGTGWSLEHGDLRIPHFVGLHAMQVLPLVALLLRRRRVAAFRRPGFAEVGRVRLMFVAAWSYVSLFGLLLWQALRGHPLVRPDSETIIALIGWAILTVASAWLAAHRHAPLRDQVVVPS